MNQATKIDPAVRHDGGRPHRAEVINAQYESAAGIAMSGFLCGIVVGLSVGYIAARMVCGVA